MHRKYAVIDLETTGPKYEQGDRIFQFGCTLITDHKIVEHITLNINPEQSIPFEIQLLTGVTNADVEKAPYFDEVAMNIYNLLEGRTLVAHNVGFDGPFIITALKEALGIELEVPFIDTVQLAQICYPSAISYRLSDLTNMLKIPHTQVHTAGSDARATAQLFLILQEKIRSFSKVTLEQLVEFSNELIGDTGAIFKDAFSIAKGKDSNNYLIENGFVVSKKVFEEKSFPTTSKVSALNAYSKLVENQFLKDNDSQRKIIKKILETLEEEEPIHFIEAPPGSGKTYAYLLAALEKATNQNPIWIVTSNLLLQQQLYEDSVLPIVSALKIKNPIVSIKGQRNYIDLKAFSYKISQLKNDKSPRVSLSVMGLVVWITETETGDLSECNQVLYQSSLWKDICVKENSKKESLYWTKAVQSVQKSNIVVTNHAFLIHYASTMSYQTKPIVLLDEVQQFEHSLEQYGTVSIKFSNLFLLQQLWSDYYLNSMTNFSKDEEHLSRTINRKLLEICDLYETWFEELNRGNYLKESIVFTNEEWIETIHHEMIRAFTKSIIQLMNYLQENSEKTSLFENSIQLLQEMKDSLLKFQESNHSYFVIERKDQYGQEMIEVLRVDSVTHVFNHFKKTIKKLIGISATIPTFTPLFYDLNAQENLTIMDSKVNSHAHHIFIPNDLVSVTAASSNQYHEQIAYCIQQIYERNGGRMLVLMHSIEALMAVEELMVNYCKRNHIELLAQKGSQLGRKIQRRFQEKSDSILLGVYSFWEGFDSGGVSINSLVITKLPFPNPVTTHQQIVQLEMKEQNRSYFAHYSIKMMLLQLYQGLGRFSRPTQKNAEIWILDVRASISKYSEKVKNIFPESAIVIEKTFKKCLNSAHIKNKD